MSAPGSGRGGDQELAETSPIPSMGSKGSGRLCLYVMGQKGVMTHRLPPIGTVTIGRSQDADIVVAEPSVSRIHAQLVMCPGQPVRLTDRGSSNGTKVCGNPLESSASVDVNLGDPIELGSTLMLVNVDRPAARLEDDPATIPLGEAMTHLQQMVTRVATSTINVLLMGETGAGKEVTARAIHDQSPRREAPFIGVNCASFNHTLFESELFGYEKGAFTGANKAKRGMIEEAHGGTLFLDEVGETPLDSQAKLLRVLELRQVVRLGSLTPRDVDVRVIAATNRDIPNAVATGEFREDLYYRLNGITLMIPPLRERPEEIIPLAMRFNRIESAALGYAGATPLTTEAQQWLEHHTWPGNVRELKNVIRRAVLLAGGQPIEQAHLHTEPDTAAGYSPSPAELVLPPPGDFSEDVKTAQHVPVRHPIVEDERQRIIDALATCGGNQTRAAKLLGISRRTLTSRLNAFNLPRPRKNRRRS